MSDTFEHRMQMAREKAVSLASALAESRPGVLDAESARNLVSSLASEDPLLASHTALFDMVEHSLRGVLADATEVFCRRLIASMQLIQDASGCVWTGASELDQLVWLSRAENALDDLGKAVSELPEFVPSRYFALH